VVEDLPPPPETVRRPQAELPSLQRAIRQLQERSHPSLKDAMGKLRVRFKIKSLKMRLLQGASFALGWRR